MKLTAYRFIYAPCYWFKDPVSIDQTFWVLTSVPACLS